MLSFSSMIKFIFFFLLFTISLQRPIVINFGVQNTNEIYRYFYGVQNDLYVDAGAFDAYTMSNTIQLYSFGWDGINIDASHYRMGFMTKNRKDNFNIAAAVGQKDQILTFYEGKLQIESSLSTKIIDKNRVDKQIKVPTVTLKDLCQRYFYKTPTFLNLDIQGFGGQALLLNDWTNPKCRFEVIFSQQQFNSRSEFPIPKQTLQKNNYTLMAQRSSRLNEVFIANEVLQKYNQRKKVNTAIINNFQFASKENLQLLFRKALNVSHVFSKDNIFFTNEHYDPSVSQVYLFISRINKVLDCKFLRSQGKRYEKNNKDRPIIVINYNPHKAPIVVQSKNYTISVIDLGQNYQFFNLTIRPQGDIPYSVYIFNHRQTPQLTFDKLPISLINANTNAQNIQNTGAKQTEKVKNLTGNVSSSQSVNSKLLEYQFKNQAKLDDLKNDVRSNHKIMTEENKKQSIQMLNSIQKLSSQKQEILRKLNETETKLLGMRTKYQGPYRPQEINEGLSLGQLIIVGLMVLILLILIPTACFVCKNLRKNNKFGFQNLNQNSSVTTIKENAGHELQ